MHKINIAFWILRDIFKMAKNIKLFSIFQEGFVTIFTSLSIKNCCALVIGVTLELNAFC